MAALEKERAIALERLREERAQQGKGLLTRLVSEQRFKVALLQQGGLAFPEVKRYERILSP